MKQKEMVAAYKWLRARLLVSQINGNHIIPGIPLNRIGEGTEDYQRKVDAAMLELIKDKK